MKQVRDAIMHGDGTDGEDGDTMAGIDPIERPGFNPMAYRPANKETMKKINSLGDAYRDALEAAGDIRRELEDEILEAKRAGHSYPQLAQASGLSISVIQRVIEKSQ